MGLSLLLWTANGASAQAKPEAAAKPSAGSATIYFLRPMPVAGFASRPDVKVDGRLVAELLQGTYVVVRVPRGVRKLSVQGGLAGVYESGLKAEAGKTYFLEIGPKDQYMPIGQQLIGRLMNNTTWTGQPLPGQGFWGNFMFYLLSEQEGRARIATLKKAGG